MVEVTQAPGEGADSPDYLRGFYEGSQTEQRIMARERAALQYEAEALKARVAVLEVGYRRGIEDAAKVVDQAAFEWAGLREGVYFDRLAKSIRALAGDA